MATAARLLLLLCAVPTPGVAPFALPSTALCAVRNVGVGGGHLLYSAEEPSSGGGDGEGEDEPPRPYVSDLKALLPTPRKRTLKLDKFGRRVHDLTDDGTTQYSKGRPPSGMSAAEVAAAIAASGPAPAYDPEPMRSDADATQDQISLAEEESGGGGGGEPPSSIVSEEPAKGPKELAADASSADFGQPVQSSADLKALMNEDPSHKSAKELAADASSADFGRPVSASADLKALLPTQKMRFMKLDKFGRRIQIMEADGTPTRKTEAPKSYSRGTKDGFGSDGEFAETAPLGPALSEILGGKGEAAKGGGGDDARLGEGAASVDLKELLPKQKMRFMKLGKFGRRMQMMEDDGTVHFQKEPSAAPAGPAASETSDSPASDEEASVDLDNAKSSRAANYGSLKDLLPTRRSVWTKLDFKGAPVEDDRRFKRKASAGSVGGEFKRAGVGNTVISGEGEGVGGGSLKELLPKRATWTRLDFRGASVIDERRTKSVSKSDGDGGDFNKGRYSNLKTLLPARTITWKKDQVLSSGSATTVSENPRGLREERQRAMRDDVIASAGARSDDDGDEEVMEDVGEEASSSEEAKSYTNLKDLLPERKFTWKRTRK